MFVCVCVLCVLYVCVWVGGLGGGGSLYTYWWVHGDVLWGHYGGSTSTEWGGWVAIT